MVIKATYLDESTSTYTTLNSSLLLDSKGSICAC